METLRLAHFVIMLRPARCKLMCSSSSSSSSISRNSSSSSSKSFGKNPELKLDFGASSMKHPEVRDPLDSRDVYLGIDGGGGGGASHMNSGGGGGGNHDRHSSAECQLSRGADIDDNDSQVRSFCCLSVDPVFDGSIWRPFSESCEDFWRPCLLPCEVQADIMLQVVSEARVTDAVLARIKKQIEDWYHSEGYVLARVVGFSGLEQGTLCCKMIEGMVTDIRVLCKDEDCNTVPGRVQQDIIRREFPRAVKEGMPYNTEAIQEAMQRVFQLHIFDEVYAEFSRNADLGGVSLDFMVQERRQDGCYFQTGLSFIATDTGRPMLSSVRPAATLSVEHRNIAGMNRTLQGYIHSNDLLSPQDDSRFKLEYVHPHIDGVRNPRDRIFRISCYNSRKLAAVFFHPRNDGNVPAVWVDRAGLKTSITEKFSKTSKLSYGFVVEEVATRDRMGTIRECAEDSGVEHVPFFHAKITRDNTRYVQGSRVGAFDTFQVDQGLGFGTTASFFNKHQLVTTRYIPLNVQSGNALPLMILRARYGGIVGDNPRYRAFTNGGPYSLRGSNAGELGNCTSFLELMGELRVPCQKSYAYSFVESFTELDGFLYHGQGTRGLARAASSGILLAVGLKIDTWRLEFVFDCGTRTGSLNVQSGDRL